MNFEKNVIETLSLFTKKRSDHRLSNGCEELLGAGKKSKAKLEPKSTRVFKNNAKNNFEKKVAQNIKTVQ